MVTKTKAPQQGDAASRDAIAQTLLDGEYWNCDSYATADLILKYWDVRWRKPNGNAETEDRSGGEA